MRRRNGELLPIEVDILEAGSALLAQGVTELHGFQIAKEIKERNAARLLTAYGTLYKALSRLEARGYLESAWEDPSVAATENRPRRRLYRFSSTVIRVLPNGTSGYELPGTVGWRVD